MEDRPTQSQNTMLLSSRGERAKKEGEQELLEYNINDFALEKGGVREETRASKIDMFNDLNELDEFTIPVIIRTRNNV